jgi:hypothetical protein
MSSFRNLGAGERRARVVLGLAMLVAGLAAALPGTASTAALLFCWVPLLTGLAGWCPFYAVLRAGGAR